ncbi:MAG: CotH kinase family protein [Deltaproteobacteria bacterium]|nr:CotH kinase family protein [Deltaproteobacteria bacterium]
MAPRLGSSIVLAASLLGAAMGMGACKSADPSCTDCSTSNPLCSGDAPETARPESWTVASHCKGVEPGYAEVLDDQALHVVTIAVSKADHEAALEDMDEKFSGGSTSADIDDLPTPMWVPVTIHYDGKSWTQVGMRYKGHASLKAAWQRGVRKLSFVLDFDRFADLDPNLKDQRFFGFAKLSFANAYNDPSLMRDKVAADIFRASGVPAARSAFAPVYMDWGEGAVYLGLYTLIEDPADTMLKSQLGDDGGNLYKPWGNAARWLSLSTIGQAEVEGHFEKATNEGDSDWSDVLAAIEALHSDRSDPAQWRARLEEHLDVASFLQALAVNQVIMNWDSYGCMHHNYLLYANQARDGRFQWLPWDLNESMLYHWQTGCPEPGSVMLDEIVAPQASGTEPATDTDWPLIQLILSDATYRAAYRADLQAVLDTGFVADEVIARLNQHHDLIAPYVLGPSAVEAYPYRNCTQEEFKSSLTSGSGALEPHVRARRSAVEAALAEDGS